MKTLTKQDAQAIINWYDSIGKSNWGVWSDYPRLSIGSSYASYDVCHCRIKFDEQVIIDGDVYQGVADSRNVPGNGSYYQIEYLKELFVDGYKEAKKEAKNREEDACFASFDFVKFSEIIKNYPVEANKHKRRAFERTALHNCGFQKCDSVSQSWGFYLAKRKINA